MKNYDRQWTAGSPYERFFDFISPGADRFGILFEHIQKLKLNLIVLTIEGNKHFFIFPQGVNLKLSAGNKFPFHGQNPVVLTAHYDRVSGSPGANDNSAAVFQMLKTAICLSQLKNTGAWIIIFTDKEELKSGEGIQDQGSYSLAKKLKSWGLSAASIFNFDACGTGDTFIFSSTTDYLLNKNSKPGLLRAGKTVKELREKAFAAARNIRLSNVLSFPVPFSDDAGFLRGGIPVQTVTMLPAAEAVPFASLLRTRPSFADIIITGPLTSAADRRLIPETWRCLNSKSDSHLRLTPEHFNKVVRFAVELCKQY